MGKVTECGACHAVVFTIRDGTAWCNRCETRLDVNVQDAPRPVHNLKTDQKPFADLKSGAKNCEVRRNDDRDFRVGDSVVLLEYADGGPTGETLEYMITHIQEGYGLQPGLCVLSYAPRVWNPAGPSEGLVGMCKHYEMVLTACGPLTLSKPQQNGEDPRTVSHLLWMLAEIQHRTDMSATKRHRWLGYVTGCMVKMGVLDVVTETVPRDFANGE